MIPISLLKTSHSSVITAEKLNSSLVAMVRLKPVNTDMRRASHKNATEHNQRTFALALPAEPVGDWVV